MINLLDVDSGQVVGSLGSSENDDEHEADDILISFALSADNQVVVSSHKSGLFCLWHLSGNKVAPII